MVYCETKEPELTFLLPCRNEEETLEFCIEEIRAYLSVSGRGAEAEILVVDNASTDATKKVAEACRVRVVEEGREGYGNALRKGIREARGRYIIMGDADGSYPFCETDKFYYALRSGAELVIGNRFNRLTERGAMPFSHRFLGVPVLSALGRFRYRVKIRDFHCGMRGICREAYTADDFIAEGMEFATEMIAVAGAKRYRLVQVDIGFRKDRRKGAGNLRSVRDGIRHLDWMRKNSLKKIRERKGK